MAGPARALLAALIACGLLAGCGGGGKVKEANRYINAVNSSQRRFADDLNRVSARITAKTKPADERTILTGYTRAVERATTAMRAIDPPSDVRDLHARLIVTVKDFAAAIEVARRELATRDATKIIDAQERVPQATTKVFREINGTLAAINRRLA